MGDVDGSGVIDKEDMNALVDAVYEGNLTGMDEEGMDLNRDGEIDLVDLQYFASLYKGKEGSDNKIIRFLRLNVRSRFRKAM